MTADATVASTSALETANCPISISFAASPKPRPYGYRAGTQPGTPAIDAGEAPAKSSESRTGTNIQPIFRVPEDGTTL